MLRTAMFGIVVCLAAAGLSFAQEPPKPGPEHAMLKELVGNWDAVMEMGGQKSKATATYKSICGGMWIASDFQGEVAGMKFEGHGLDGYDQVRKKYVGMWVDSMGSVPLNFLGDYDAKTKALTMVGESTAFNGKQQKFKTVTETKDKDHFIFKMFMVEADGKEQLAFTIDYTRRK